MNITLQRQRSSRLSRGAVLVPATLAAVLACWSLAAHGGAGSPIAADPASATVAGAPAQSAPGARVALRLPDGPATAILDDTPAAQAFATMLPLTLVLHDPMGQAKSGRLPHPIDVTGAARVTDPAVGVIYYWPPSGDIAIFYDDLGQTVPPPGLVRLGFVDSGLDAIASAGNRFTLRIHPA